MTVITLPGVVVAGNTSSAEVIERLESLLERARAGEIAGFSYGYAEPNGDAHFGWVGSNLVTVTGALSIAQHQLISSFSND